ncbi:MAG: VWA domain-containing protein [Symploca sp. SIO2E6]|nr:VWA domain-containing protein [Symploca sp. SIO2E6]
MSSHRRVFWLSPLFQIPLMFLVTFLAITALFWLLGLGRPPVTVAIALDLSSSTGQLESQDYERETTVMGKEVRAVRAYLEKNASELGERSNQVQIFGFGGAVQPLTESFNSQRQQIESQLTQSLKNPDLSAQIVPGKTDLDLAIRQSTNALINHDDHCRELLIVTDGQEPVSPSVIAEAVNRQVKINAVVVGGEAPSLRGAALATEGTYLTSALDTLEVFFTNRLFADFNSNLKWIIFWLGLAWIAFMWTITLPLDEYFFQQLLGLNWSLAGKLALSHAFFWTVATPGIIWRIAGGIPLISAC